MSKGRFGIHGGQYIPETLMNAVIELEEAYNHFKEDPEFVEELNGFVKQLCRTAIKALFCRKDDERFRRGKDLFETGGSQSYRLP